MSERAIFFCTKLHYENAAEKKNRMNEWTFGVQSEWKNQLWKSEKSLDKLMFVSNAEIQLREMRNPREQTQIQFFSFSFVAITSKEFSEKFWFLNSMLDAQWFFGCQLERIVHFLLHRPRFRTAWMNEKKNQFTLHRVFPNIFHFTLIFIHWFTDEGIMNVHIKFIARSIFC